MNGGQSNMPSGVTDSQRTLAVTSSPQLATSWLKDVSTNPILAREAGVFRPSPSNMVDLRQYAYAGRPPGPLVNQIMPVLPGVPTNNPSSSATTTEQQQASSYHNSPALSPVTASPYRGASRPAETASIPAKRMKYDFRTSSQPDMKNETSSIPHRPDYFHKGSIIQLADTNMKRIEDLKTTDFESSAYLSPNLALDCSSIVEIKEDGNRGTALITFAVGDPNRTDPIKATVEATLEHPFFVFTQGWCSISPNRTLQFYQLDCKKLRVGDRCVSLTYSEKPGLMYSGKAGISGMYPQGNGQTRPTEQS